MKLVDLAFRDRAIRWRKLDHIAHAAPSFATSPARCSNPGCHHSAELDVSSLLDDVTFNDMQPRMLCTTCDHRGADVSPSWQHGRDRADGEGKVIPPAEVRQKAPT